MFLFMFTFEANTWILVWVHFISIFLSRSLCASYTDKEGRGATGIYSNSHPLPVKRMHHYNCITPAFSWSISNNAKPINFSFPSSQENAGGAEACFARVSLEFWFTVAIQVLQVWSSKVQKHYPAFCPQQEVERSVRSWRPLPWQDHMDSWAVSDGGRRSHLRDWKNKNNKKAVRW